MKGSLKIKRGIYYAVTTIKMNLVNISKNGFQQDLKNEATKRKHKSFWKSN